MAHVAGANRENYENGDGRDVLNTAGNDRDYLFKICMLDWADHNLRLSAQKNTATGDANWGGSGSDMGEASDKQSAVSQEVERLSYTLDHRHAPKNNSLIDWKFNLYTNDNSLENIDAGTGLFLPEDHFSAEVTYFNTRLTNTIEVESGGRRGQPITAIYNNPDTLTSKGYEVNFTWAVTQFRTMLAFSSFETEDGDGNPAGIIRRKTAASGDQLIWDLKWDPKPNLTFGYTLTYVADLTKVPEGDSDRPGYILHAVQASWRPEAINGLTLSLAVDNFFDKYYCNQTSIEGDDGAISEPGRDIRLAVSYQF